MLLLLGKTSSGKNTIRNELLKKGLKPVITYTTRPKRENEKDGVDYYFITDEQFESMKDGFLCTSAYEVENGDTWYYGIPSINLGVDDVLIVTPKELETIKQERPNSKIISVYLLCDEGTIWNRIRLRGDDNAEARRRINADEKDFKNILEYVDMAIRNKEGDQVQVASLIYEYYVTNLASVYFEVGK